MMTTMTTMTTGKIHWSDVTLYSEGLSNSDRHTVAKAMQEYQETGAVTGYFLNENEEWDGGPSVEEIDFTGLEDALSESYMAD